MEHTNDPPPPPDAAPPAPAVVSPEAGAVLLARLSRAVQRATIYPQGHPSVRLATGPFIETLVGLLGPQARLVIGVTSDHIFVGSSPEDARPYESPWLSSRLSARGIASIRFDATVDVATTEEVVGWLAHGPELAPNVPPPAFDGVLVTPLDFTGLRFRERAALDESSPAAFAWRSMTRQIAGDWLDSPGDVPLEPGELAQFVLNVIENQEGTGVRQITDRVIALGGQMASLPTEVRAAVKLRLADFIAALSPELRGQLLAAAPSDPAAKLELLGELVDNLPRALVVDLIRHLEFRQGGSTAQFIAFMIKLAGVASAEGHAAEAFETRCVEEGLPPDLVFFDPEHARQVLQDLLAQAATEPAIPDAHRDRLEQLSATTLAAVRPVDTARHVDPRTAEDVAAQAARIALVLFSACESDEDRLACLTRLKGQLATFLEASEIGVLAEAIDVLDRTAKSSGAGAKQAESILRFFGEAETVQHLVRAVERAPGEVPAALVTVARASGLPFAQAVFLALARRPDHDTRERFTGLLVALDPEIVRAAVVAAYRKDPASARALVSACSAIRDASLVADAAHVFLADREPGVRSEAYRLLFASRPSATRFEGALRRALDDEDPRIVEQAVVEAGRRVPLVGARALAAFITDGDAERFERQQLRAVGVLASAALTDARAHLAALLAQRHSRLDAPSRRVSRAVADALADGNPSEAAAAKAWRRSPAGFLSRMMGDAGGRPS